MKESNIHILSVPSLGYNISSLSYQTEALVICKNDVPVLVISM